MSLSCADLTTLLQDFMNGKLPPIPGEYPTLNDWENHLTTIFPEVCKLHPRKCPLLLVCLCMVMEV